MKSSSTARVFIFFFAVSSASCTNIGDFNTEAGECYQGKIAGADYVRSSTFDDDVGLTLTLDVDTLVAGEPTGGGTLTTDDGRFADAPVAQMQQLAHDSLSLLQFPGGRVRNFLAFANPSDNVPATIIISLMENDAVEVRILRPDPTPEDAIDDALFGVFRLLRQNDCRDSSQ